jgi:hypothetical protein
VRKQGESTEKPKRSFYMEPAVEAAMTKQLDKAFKEDEGNNPLAERTREPTLTKISSEAFYEKVAAAVCGARLHRKLKNLGTMKRE